MSNKSIRYDSAFKQRVVDEISIGKESVVSASLKYNIGGSMTIYRWLNKYQKGTLPSMKNSQPTSKPSESEDKDNNSEIEALRLKVLALETMIDVAEKELGISIRKKSSAKQSKNSENE